MLQKVIQQIIMDSFGSQSYGKAIDCMKALRVESIKVAVFLSKERIGCGMQHVGGSHSTAVVLRTTGQHVEIDSAPGAWFITKFTSLAQTIRGLV